ncbi:MAG: hypothetical protein PHR69_08425, partial [Sphaerochaeta sp.]|nr:hypothetical protein [Sphaerochaeta sp.]
LRMYRHRGGNCTELSSQEKNWILKGLANKIFLISEASPLEYDPALLSSDSNQVKREGRRWNL